MRWNRLHLLVVVVVAAPACRKSRPVPLTVASVAGCYQVTDSVGHRLGKVAGFWAAAVRLDTVRRAGDADEGETAEPGDYVAITTAPVQARDTAFYRASWEVLPPDTLVITRSTRFMGEQLRLMRVGIQFVGRATWFGDALDSGPRGPGTGVRATRMACPTALRSESRPVA